MNVKKMYRELILTSLIMNVFDAFITAGAMFAIGYFITYFYRLSIYFALGAAAIIFVRSLIMKIRQNKILLLESKFPNLKERLRTSYDYQDQNNTVISELHHEVLSFMQQVDVNAFLSNKDLLIRVFLICTLMFGTLYFSSLGFDILDIRTAVIKSNVYRKASDFAANVFDQNREEVKTREKLDDPRIITPGDKEINLSIDAYNTELDINDISSPDKNDFGGNYPADVSGTAQQVYEEKIPEEYKDAVKEYFKKINR